MSKPCIFIAGPPAAGKSTFAHALSGALQVPCFTKDALNELIGAHMPIPDDETRRALSLTSVRVLLHIAERALEAGKAVLLESNFKPHEIALAEALLARQGAAALTYVFTADMETLYARFMARERSEERPEIHKFHQFPDATAFEAAVSPLADFAVSGERVVVDTSDFSAVGWAELIQKARDFFAENAD